MTKLKEEQKQELLENESNILAGVLGAAKEIEDTEVPVVITRNGEEAFRFHVAPQSAEVFEKAGEFGTAYRTDKRGRKFVESTSVTKANAYLILRATTKKDRDMIWENKEVREALGEFTAVDVIQRVLLAGEMQAIVELIEELSGYSLNKEDVAEKERKELDELKN